MEGLEETEVTMPVLGQLTPLQAVAMAEPLAMAGVMPMAGTVGRPEAVGTTDSVIWTTVVEAAAAAAGVGMAVETTTHLVEVWPWITETILST